MKEIHILSGMPASGKTTFAKDYVRWRNKIVHMSRDSFRASIREVLKSEDYFPISAAEEWQGWTSFINSYIEAGHSVMIDQTTLGKGALLKLLKAITIPEDYGLFVHIFPISLQECQWRNGFREGFEYVPPKTMQSMYKAAFKYLETETVKQLIEEAKKPNMPAQITVFTHSKGNN